MSKAEIYLPALMVTVGLLYAGLKVGALTSELQKVTGVADTVGGLFGGRR